MCCVCRWCAERSDAEVIREREAIIAEIEQRGLDYWFVIRGATTGKSGKGVAALFAACAWSGQGGKGVGQVLPPAVWLWLAGRRPLDSSAHSSGKSALDIGHMSSPNIATQIHL